MFLLKIEQELTQLVKDGSRDAHRFQPMTSYNRMLVHRVAAFYGCEHNIEKNEQGTGIVVSKTKNTRIPELRFNDYIKDELETSEPKKLILKRDSASADDPNGDGIERSPDRQTGVEKGKSFEEREELYSRARARIFNQESSSSSSAEASSNENTIPVILENKEDKSDGNTNSIQQKDASLLNTQDIKVKSKWNHESTRQWNSADSSDQNTHRLRRSKQNCQGNSLDADYTYKSNTNTNANTNNASSSMTLLSPDRIPNHVMDSVSGNHANKGKPAVTKASSFAGISRDNSLSVNGNQHKLIKSGSFNATATNNSGTNTYTPSITPKTIGSHQQHQQQQQQHQHQQQQQKKISHQPVITNSMQNFYNQHTSGAASHPNAQWMPTIRRNEQFTSNNSMNWPPQLFPNAYTHPFIIANSSGNKVVDLDLIQIT